MSHAPCVRGSVGFFFFPRWVLCCMRSSHSLSHGYGRHGACTPSAVDVGRCPPACRTLWLWACPTLAHTPGTHKHAHNPATAIVLPCLPVVSAQRSCSWVNSMDASWSAWERQAGPGPGPPCPVLIRRFLHWFYLAQYGLVKDREPPYRLGELYSKCLS